MVVNVRDSANTILEILCFGIITTMAMVLCILDFKLYGDIFRFMGLFILIFLLLKRDFAKAKELVCVLIIVLGFSYCIKMIIVILANYDMLSSSALEFAMRPINGIPSGFPSGHTTFAFISAAFAYCYFDYKWKVLFFILAIMVGISRIISLWHTPLQVFFGFLIGFLFSVFLLKSAKLKILCNKIHL